MLLGHGRHNVKSLAAELECSEKTVHRYLAVLEIAGVPWYYDGHERCYRVRPGFKFSVSNLTPDELLGQAAATAVIQAPGLDAGASSTAVTRKIAAVSAQEAADLLSDAGAVMTAVDLKMADHARHHEMIRAIQWSLIKGKQVTGQYQSPYQDHPVRLTLNPYRLCLAGQAWYLIARAAQDKVPKTYRIARFQSLRMIDLRPKSPRSSTSDEVFRERMGCLSWQGELRGGDRVHQGSGCPGD